MDHFASGVMLKTPSAQCDAQMADGDAILRQRWGKGVLQQLGTGTQEIICLGQKCVLHLLQQWLSSSVFFDYTKGNLKSLLHELKRRCRW